MTIYEYINKNLPNLNWNILPQIFESEGVELTEDIEKYLRETPGNTNWNLLRGIINKNESEEKLPKVIKITDFGVDESIISDDSDLKTAQEIYNWCEAHSEISPSGDSMRVATDIEFYIFNTQADIVHAENITPAPTWSAYAGDMYVYVKSDGTIVCSYDD